MAPLTKLISLCLLQAVLSSAAPAPDPMITPAPSRTTCPQQEQKMGLLAQRDVDVASYVDGVLSGLGSSVQGFVASGVPDYFQGFPTGTAVLSSAGVSKTDIDARPTEVLNLPAYANWTDGGWNVRLHGNVYKQPDIPQDKLDELANKFLVGTDIKDLPPDQQAQARNLTAEIYVVQQENQQVTFDFVDDVSVAPEANGGAVNAEGGAQTVTLPVNTTSQGDFDEFTLLQNTTGPSGGALLPGNATLSIQTLNVYARGTDTGNATAYLVPPVGLTIVSDIDDVLRVTKIYVPKEGLLNSFARPFTPWLNMPEIYEAWARTVPDFHFHYLTTTPEQVTRNYMDYIYKTYPLGSFDTRPLNFSDVSATLEIRRFLLDKIFQTFPRRKFILVGDTSNSDIMKAYPALAKDYPNQVQCIFLRNTSATDPDDRFPYDTSGFEGLPQRQYMFFTVPDDLAPVDIINGNCWNQAVRQNVTFKTQGLPFGAAGSVVAPTVAHTLGVVVALVVALLTLA